MDFSFVSAHPDQLLTAFRLSAWPLLLLPLAWLVARRLDLLSFGDDVAASLGVTVERTRLFAAGIGVALAAAAVATVGTVGFVGLLAPHATRLVGGHQHRRLLPVATLLGAALLGLADLVGRVALAPKEDLLVRTHGSVDVCCAKFGYPIYQELRTGCAISAAVRAWRVSNFGGHRFAPTLLELPAGRFWGFVESQHLPVLMRQTGSVSDLRGCYRGWAALPSAPEQVAEREACIAHGWAWDSYRKRCQVVEESDGVTVVHLTYEDMASSQSGTCIVPVDVAGTLTTQGQSGGPPLQVKQYRVTQMQGPAMT